MTDSVMIFFNLPFIYSLKGQFTQNFSFTHLLPATTVAGHWPPLWPMSPMCAQHVLLVWFHPSVQKTQQSNLSQKQKLCHHIFQPKYPLFTLAKVKSFPLWKRFCRLENASINVAASKKWMKFQIWVTYPFTNPQGGRRQIQKSATRI